MQNEPCCRRCCFVVVVVVVVVVAVVVVVVVVVVRINVVDLGEAFSMTTISYTSQVRLRRPSVTSPVRGRHSVLR